MTNRRIAWLVVLAGALFLACGQDGETPAQPADDVINHTGTVESVGSVGFAIVDDHPEHERFAPTNLPDEFKKSGARVLFSGRRGEIPPNARLWGTPLHLSSIRPDMR